MQKMKEIYYRFIQDTNAFQWLTTMVLIIFCTIQGYSGGKYFEPLVLTIFGWVLMQLLVHYGLLISSQENMNKIQGGLGNVLRSSQNEMKKLQDKLDLQNNMKEIFTFSKMSEQMENAITNSEKVWLLSRTGMGWINKGLFTDKLKEMKGRKTINENEKIRFLVIDPRKEALIIASNVMKDEWRDNDFYKETTERNIPGEVIQFLNQATNKYNGIIDFKVIDYVPAWTLLFINPNIDPKSTNFDTTIYVELATYNNSNSKSRPVLKFTSLSSADYIHMFTIEFKEMWDKAKFWNETEEYKNYIKSR